MKLQCKNENVLLTDLYAEAGAFDFANGLKITFYPTDRNESNIEISSILFKFKIRIVQNVAKSQINYYISAKIKYFVGLDKLDVILNFGKSLHILLKNGNYFELVED